MGTGGWTSIGLTKAEIENAKRIFKQDTGKDNVSEKAYLIKGRAPILALHIIEAKYAEPHSPDLPPFLFALGVGFPKTDLDTETANYKINLVELRNLYGDSDESDEEEWPNA